MTRRALTCRVNRLKQELPQDLCDLIDGKTEPGTYRLKVASNEIFLGDVSEDGVVEITEGMNLREVLAMRQSLPNPNAADALE